MPIIEHSASLLAESFFLHPLLSGLLWCLLENRAPPSMTLSVRLRLVCFSLAVFFFLFLESVVAFNQRLWRGPDGFPLKVHLRPRNNGQLVRLLRRSVYMRMRQLRQSMQLWLQATALPHRTVCAPTAPSPVSATEGPPNIVSEVHTETSPEWALVVEDRGFA